MNNGMTMACAGSICTISSMIRNVARNRNRKRATATAASSDTSEASTTVTTVTSRLLRKNTQNEMPSPAAWPFITLEKLCSVGCSGTGCGVRENSSPAGLNAVETIQKIGNSVTRATITPRLFSAAFLVLREVRRREWARDRPKAWGSAVN